METVSENANHLLSPGSYANDSTVRMFFFTHWKRKRKQLLTLLHPKPQTLEKKEQKTSEWEEKEQFWKENHPWFRYLKRGTAGR